MTSLHPTITCQLSLTAFPHVLARLTAWCVQTSCAFLHTMHHAEHHDFDIFPAPPALPLGVRLYIVPGNHPTLYTPEVAQPWPAEATVLLHHVLQQCLKAQPFGTATGSFSQA